MPTPRPGQRVRGSETGRPIMVLLDLLGRRWMLRILWELREGPVAFRELQRRCDMPSPNVLSTRLREACDSGILEKDAVGHYTTTRRGRRLGALLEPLHAWAKEWGRSLR